MAVVKSLPAIGGNFWLTDSSGNCSEGVVAGFKIVWYQYCSNCIAAGFIPVDKVFTGIKKTHG